MGNILFLDRDDINTDEIIPAKYLTEIYKKELKPHLFEDLTLEGFSIADIAGKDTVVTRSNYGCGSSREHAPWALEVNGIRTVIASGYARIFRQNMFNCGLLPIELPGDAIETIFKEFSGTASDCEVDIKGRKLTISSEESSREFNFDLSDFHFDLIQAGGWVGYAAAKY